MLASQSRSATTALRALLCSAFVLAACDQGSTTAEPSNSSNSSSAGAPGTAGAGGGAGAGGAATGGGGTAPTPTSGSAGADEPQTMPSSGGASAGGGGAGPASTIGFDWGKAVIDTALANKNGWGSQYTDGLLLHGIYLASKRLNDSRYREVVLNAADGYGPSGGGSLDDIMHLTAVVDAYDLDPRDGFKSAASATRRIFDGYPTTTEGGFWHSRSLREQLWGDGTFMSLAFLSRYATVFHDTSAYPLAVTELSVTAKHVVNPATGLYWHAWDETGDVGWAKASSKTNEISWGRAMGWFVVASAMTLEALPADDAGRPQVEQTLVALLTSLAKYQDATTGRWYQVVDKAADPENWLETSCSSMFSYGFWWAYKHHLGEPSFGDVARKGLMGVLQKVTKDGNDRTAIATICQGLNASADLVGNYYHHGVASNDPHGVGAFVLMWEGMQ
ncbi:MAG TPA: glycoside hydrolase family 88 protein [Polyangiaceae bacterium]|nr:glycoside hydrolase family 88 protein [Polyangiaceae bacterium]